MAGAAPPLALKRFALSSGSAPNESAPNDTESPAGAGQQVQGIPALGLGTWQSPPGAVHAAVLEALRAGYRHLDCAFMYGNEAEVGSGLAAAVAEGTCARSEVFVTTKLASTFHRRAAAGLARSLENLGLAYVDLFLMHWPVALNAPGPGGDDASIPRLPDGRRDIDHAWPHTRTWAALEDLLDGGQVRAVGVCNCSVPYLRAILQTCRVRPAVNQIEAHPLLPQPDVMAFCAAERIHVTAYSPLGSTGGPLFAEPAVRTVARRRAVSEAVVLLSWHVARGRSVLAKSVTPHRIRQNFELVALDDADLAELDSIAAANPPKRFVWPDWNVPLGFADKP